MLNASCNGLIFIDCMSNSGIYLDDAGEHEKGTLCGCRKDYRSLREYIQIRRCTSI